MTNIMRDIPRKDTQPLAHARLLLCMFVPFFHLDDLKTTGESWTAAFTRVETSHGWDSRKFPLRLNVKGIFAQKLAAAEDTAKRQAQNASFAATTEQQNAKDADEVHVDNDGDDLPGESVIPTSLRPLQTEFFVRML